MNPIQERMYTALCQIPTHDTHTHIDAAHPVARGLHDILLYHMVITELYSAGCPDGARLSEEPTEEEALYRLERAVPYVRYIRNTSCYWGVRIILRDLFDWNEEITEENWRELHARIQTYGRDMTRAKEIMGKANLVRSSTELWRGHGHIADDVFDYTVEWAFFTRCQWGQYDTALVELEHAWNEESPGAPLPVTTDVSSLHFDKTIRTMADVDTAMTWYCDRMPYKEVFTNASHFSTDIQYRTVTRGEMAAALARRDQAGPAERDIYASYLHELFLSEQSRRKTGLLLSYSIGSEPLPFEGGSKLRTETVYDFARIAERYPDIQFDVYLSSAAHNQAFCTVAREIPNVRMVGYWWHNFFPCEVEKVMDERLDMLPLNRQVGFFSDAYCMEWSYAKLELVRRSLATVLAKRIERGQYTFERAIAVAEAIL